jgi:hypothetical protein
LRRNPTTCIKGLAEPRSPPISPRPTTARLAAELVLAQRQIADHAAPDSPCLVVARLGKAAAQGEDQRHRVLGDGAGVDAARAGEADAAPRQLVARKLVGAGADRLDEAQLRRAVEEAVLP